MRVLKQIEFINRAKMIFPNYDFSKVVYVNNKTKVCVICPKHGEFFIRPDCLLSKTGCPKCGGTNKTSQEEFIKKANIVHNNYFTYEKCVYNGSDKKIIVTCPIHGDFEVKANAHLIGHNCKKCQKEKIFHKITKLEKRNKSTKKLTTEEFIKKAKEIRGNKYDYSKVEYVNNRTKVCIICPEHGKFEITPNHFLANRGCPKCGKNKKLTTEEFIKKAKQIHGDKYDYLNVKYKKTHEKITITCKKHGNFETMPSNFLKGEGCPICNEKKLEREIRNLFEKNKINFIPQKRFDWLGRQSLDFYLPDYNVAIECQGIQHFEPVEFFGGNEGFKKQIERDKIKKELCKKNGINVLYFTNEKCIITENLFTDLSKILNVINNYGRNK